MKSFFSSKTATLEAAIDYADKKIPVFQIFFYETTKDFGHICSFSDATTDKKIIQDWFTENPDALIAIPSGAASGIVAISVDEGTTFTAKTPCFTNLFGKKTYLFKLPEGESFSSGKKDGLSWKGDLGSIVLPSPLEVVADGELEDLPAEIMAKMKESAESEEVAAQEEEKKHFSKLPTLPLDKLTTKFRQLIEMTSESLCVEPWLPFSVALKTASSCIGANALLYGERTKIKSSAHLWITLIAPSGTGKTRCVEHFSRPVKREQAALRSAYKNALEFYKEQLVKFEEEKKALAAGKEVVNPTPQPIKPPKTAFYVDDITPEALVSTLQDNPGGILLESDELKSSLKSFGRYGAAGAAEAFRSRLLSMYDGNSIEVARKSDDSIETIKHAWLSIFGTIQPEVLKTAFEKDDNNSGFLQRFTFIFAENTELVDLWDRKPLPDSDYLVEDIFGKLATFPRIVLKQHASEEEILDQRLEPKICVLEEAAEKLLCEYITKIERAAIAAEKIGLISQNELSVSKRWGSQLMRLTLCMHCIKSAENGLNSPSLTVKKETVADSMSIFSAMIEHSKEAWRLFRGEERKTTKNINLIDTVDKYMEKNGAVYTLSFSKKIEGKTVVSIIKDEINNGGLETLQSTQALTKALEKLGFKTGREAAGTKMTINKAVYEEAIKLLEEQKTMLPKVTTRKNREDEIFCSEIISGMSY